MMVGRVRFLSPSEGGRSSPASSGVRSQLRLGELFTSVIVEKLEGDERFIPGRWHAATVRLLFSDTYDPLLRGGPFELYEGTRLVAVGTCERIVPPRRSRPQR